MKLEKFTNESEFIESHSYAIVVYSSYEEHEYTSIEEGDGIKKWLTDIENARQTAYDDHVVGYVDLTKADEENMFTTPVDLDHQAQKVFKVGEYTWDDEADWSDGEPEKTKLVSTFFTDYISKDSWEIQKGEYKVLGELSLDYKPFW